MITNESVSFRRFVWRNGRCYDAHEYGHKAWPIKRGKRKRK